MRIYKFPLMRSGVLSFITNVSGEVMHKDSFKRISRELGG